MTTSNQARPVETIKVVVIEDNEDDRQLLLRQLTKASMASMVKFITDGQEALDFFEGSSQTLARSLKVIFLDLKLPTISGLVILRHLKTISSLNEIPVIVMTSSNNPKDVEECRLLKVANYVEKPVTFHCFTKAMADVLPLR